MDMAAIILETEWTKLILTLIGISFVTIAAVACGAYVFIRVFASIANSQRDEWESTGQELGFTVDRTAAAIRKTLRGVRGGRDVAVTFFAIPRNENSADPAAEAKVPLQTTIPFSFKIEKPEAFQKLVDLFGADGPETGNEVFDKVFRVSASDRISLLQLLHLELPGGQSPTLLTDLLLAAKRFSRVRVSDESVAVGLRADPRDSEAIENAISRALYLAGRIEAAAIKMPRTEA